MVANKAQNEDADVRLMELQDAVTSVLNDVESGVTDELGAIRKQTDQIQCLLKDAIAALHESFERLDGDASELMSMMSTLMMEAVGQNNENSEDLNIFQRTDHAGKILAQLVEMIMQSSRNDLRELEYMGEVRIPMDRLVKGMQTSRKLLNRLDKMANGGTVDAEQLKHLVDEARAEHEVCEGSVNEAMQPFSKLHKLVVKAASREMNEVFKSRSGVEDIIKHFNSINDLISSCRSDVSTLGANMRKDLGAVIRALQFEDIVSQSLGHTELHMDRMEGFARILAENASGMDKVRSDDIEGYTNRLKLLQDEVAAYRKGLLLEETNPVSQQNMDEGDVELF
ncbi:MAG: hypothetical protein Q9M24_09005 [Mariprofundaceae bacterium]|nr:hypothetical protein [Mariprofundaceae bacterium]